MSRHATAGRIDRSATLRFRFGDRELTGFAGDTLASALLANDVREVGRSVNLGRPRGIVSAGVEEPNAVVQIDEPFPEPMLTATTVELYDGLVASPLSGRGRLAASADPARYDAVWAHCDTLVVGAGRSGIAAARDAAAAGHRVILAESDPYVVSAADLFASKGDLSDAVRVLGRTTVAGYYDDGFLLAVQRRTQHLGFDAPAGMARERLWRIRAGRVILATGAHERPLPFANNDRPGVMLAGAARTYLHRYGVLVGRRAVAFTANDSAYRVAADLAGSGIDIVAIVDTRPEPGAQAARLVSGIRLMTSSRITGVTGDNEVTGVTVSGRHSGSFEADLVLSSGGWSPVLHLYSQAGGRLRYDADLGALLPDGCRQRVEVVGSAAGTGLPRGGLVIPERPADNPLVAEDPVFVDLARDVTTVDVARATAAGLRSVEHVKRYTTASTAHDQGKTSSLLTSAALAAQLSPAVRPAGGAADVPLGDARDGDVSGAEASAAQVSRADASRADMDRTETGPVDVGRVGVSSYRPPYTPIAFATLAGRDRGDLFDPVRVTPMHEWHDSHGALFENVGQWRRAWYYPRDGEDLDAAVARETRAARRDVAMMDATTLGKIDVQGPDAAEFLDRLYTNVMSTLPVGRCRYGLMCDLTGMVLDDGTVARLADARFLVTTTTGNAARILDWMEEWLQTEWPDLRVWCTSVTEQWATVALVGPRSREVLGRLAPELPVDALSFPFLAWRDATVADLTARVFRISFSGELAFEVNVSAWHGLALWQAIIAEGVTPYGTETMHVLRAEKGYPIVGQDTDGTVTPYDLGLGWAVSKPTSAGGRRRDFIGLRSLRRADTARPDRKHLVGLLPEDPTCRLPEGTHLVDFAELPAPPVPYLGHVTSSYHSEALGRTFALGLIAAGRDRIGQRLFAPLDGAMIAVTVVGPVLYDPEGKRRDG